MKNNVKKDLAGKIVEKEKKKARKKIRKAVRRAISIFLGSLLLLGAGFFLGVHRHVILAMIRGEQPPEAPAGHLFCR